MRCENCGREIDNAQLWQLGADPKAPSAWSMRVLCWDCREHPHNSTREGIRLVTPASAPAADDSGHPESKAS